jgi:hypothetical protein
MRIDELLGEGRVPELELIPSTGNTRVVQYKGRRLVITGGRRISTRMADFSIGAWYFSMDGGAQLPCWVTGPNSAVCGLNS